jgi:hypothetical protein
MLIYTLYNDETYRKILVEVEDDRVENFEIDPEPFRSERELHGWIQGIIATKLKEYERDRVSFKAGRHDRGWPKS